MENKKIQLKKLKKFWKGKRVFLTGHTGFKGSWMCILLNILGAQIIGYSLKPEKKSLFLLADIKKILKKNIYSNILNLKKLNSKKSNKFLNWKPIWNLNDTLNKTIEWNMLNKNGFPAKKICENQIFSYFNT